MTKIFQTRDMASIRFICVVVFLSVLIGCGASSVRDKKFIKEVESTKQSISSFSLRSAASDFFSESATNDHVVYETLPERIRILPIFSDDPHGVLIATYRDANVVEFDIGGGFEHKGIFICLSNSENPEQFLKSFQGTICPWTNGVFFWADWHVRGIPKRYWNERG
jgi:hypothetical protein